MTLKTLSHKSRWRRSDLCERYVSNEDAECMSRATDLMCIVKEKKGLDPPMLDKIKY